MRKSIESTVVVLGLVGLMFVTVNMFKSMQPVKTSVYSMILKQNGVVDLARK